MYKDKTGFMWIGTKNGLNRYDGHSFKIFRPGSGNSISNEVINDIKESDDGLIWVATMEGLNYYDPVKNHWENIIPASNSNNKGLPSLIIWNIAMGPNHLVWIASDVFEFCSYNRLTRQYKYYNWPAFAKSDPHFTNTSYSSIQRFVSRNDHEFWLGTSCGLASLDVNTGKFSFIGSGYNDNVIDLRYDPVNKKIFCTTESNQMFTYDEALAKYEEVFPASQPYPSTKLAFNGDHEIWMASKNGLVEISDDRKKISLRNHVSQLSGSLLPGGINSVYFDDKKIRWVATNNGINKYDYAIRPSSFLPLQSVSDKEGQNVTASAYFDKTCNRYFVCAGATGTVFIIDGISGQIEKLARDESGKIFTSCNHITCDNQNNIWLLTDNHVYQYNRDRNSFQVFQLPNKEAHVTYTSLMEDAEGNYWFGSFSGGVYYYKVKEKKFIQFSNNLSEIVDKVSALCSDTLHKTVWICTFSEGLYRYDLLTHGLTRYYDTTTAPDLASLTLANDIRQDRKGKIWIATYSGGVYLFNEGKSYEKSFTHFNMRNGLDNNNYISLCDNGDTVMWMLSGKGISSISTNGNFLNTLDGKRSFNFSSYSSDRRISHSMFYDPAKKQLLVGVAGGLLFLSTGIANTLLDFPVVMTSIKVDGNQLYPSGNPGNKYRMASSSNKIQFEFAALYYGSSSGMDLEYKLSGYDKDWISANGNYTSSYQNLPPGNFIFEIREKNKQGQLSASMTAFSFRVVPPFWKTWWFVTLFILLVAFTVYLFIQSLRQKLKAEKVLNYFATSLYGQNTIEDVFWDVAKNCINQLKFEDCVVYQYDEQKKILTQKAAYGPKNPEKHEIINRIEIPLGKGIVGTAAASTKPVIVSNTSKDSRYIVDDEKRLSEIAVPILVDGKLFGVIDSENSQKRFFKTRHLTLLKKIADTCGAKISKYLVEDRLRSKIARDLHDEMGSTLTSINIMSKVAIQESQPGGSVENHLKKIKDYSGRMMESMSDIVWAINPANDGFEKMLIRMKEFAAEMLEPAKINYYFREEGKLFQLLLNPEQRQNIFLVYKEAMNNAVKYSEATEVTINLKEEDHVIRMTITDNGKGFDNKIISSGNGLRNMNARAEQINGKLKILSIAGSGTKVELEAPIT